MKNVFLFFFHVCVIIAVTQLSVEAQNFWLNFLAFPSFCYAIYYFVRFEDMNA